jgi:hypothetical protein
MIIGGPMLINYVMPSEEELFKKYNPDLQRRSLEGREQRLQEANDFIAQLKTMSKSDKPCMCIFGSANWVKSHTSLMGVISNMRCGMLEEDSVIDANTSQPVWTVWKEQELAEQEKRRKQEAELKAQRKNIAEEIRKQRLGESSG